VKCPGLSHGFLFLTALLSAAKLAAQDAYFHPISIPPSAAGTCLPTRNRSPGKGGLIAANLSIKSITPGRSRDMMVIVDTLGHTIGYSELEITSTGLGSGVSEAYVTSFTQSGRVSGFASHITTEMPPMDMNHLDTASLRKMRENAKTVSSRRPLDASEQRRAREVADWLRKRCPS
jgi:hypothetical protein